MDIKTYVVKKLNEYNDNEIIVYGGNSEDNVFMDIILNVSYLITGFNKKVIEFENNHYNGRLSYNLKGEGYYYNSANYDTNYKLVDIDGNGGKMIKTIFDFIEKISEEDFEKWNDILDTMPDIYYYKKCEKDGYNKYINFDEETFQKMKHLNKIHKNLISEKTEDIILKLEELLPYWENDFVYNDNFFNKTKYSGKFINNDLPNIKITKNNIIIFPDDSRASICSNFLVTDDMEILFNKKEGESIAIRNKRKGSKTKIFTILEHNNDKVAIRNDNNEILFVTWLSSAESCWDDLFDCNKREFNQWKRNKVDIFDNEHPEFRKIKINSL